MKKRYYFFFLFVGMLSSGFCARSQIITTFAGNGVGAYAGDSGMATDAAVYVPSYIAAARDGSILIADYGNNRIRRVDGAGVITTIAGTGALGYSGNDSAATLATMFRPTGIVTDAAGNIFFTDNGNYAVRKIRAGGIITAIAGNGIAAYTGDGGAATAAQFVAPDGLAIDASGNLYVPDGGAHCIRKIATTGIITTIAGTGVAGYAGDGGAATAAQLNKPVDVAVDTAGNIFCTDQNNNVIRKIDRAGIITTIAGTGVMGYWGDNGAATAALLNRPAGIFADDSGQLFFADFFNNRVRKINAAGMITTIAGIGLGGYTGDGGPATAARLRLPNKLIIDHCGNYLIADRSNHRIRKVTFPNPLPFFIATEADTVHTCLQVAVSPSGLLAAFNAYTCQDIVWSVSAPPGHGTLLGFPVTEPSVGDTITPSGLSYIPGAGYTGVDSFAIMLSDGVDTVHKKLYVQVHPLPVITPISGPDSLCPGDTAMFTCSTSGGIWSVVNPAIGTIDTSGRLIGLTPGTDTVIYTATTAWCIASVRNVYKVSLPEACINGIIDSKLTITDNPIEAMPNPTTGRVWIIVKSLLTEQVAICVTNAYGQNVLVTSTATNKRTELPLPDGAGVYQVRAFNHHMATTARILKIR